MYLLDILNYHVFKRHLFSTGWFENKLQKPKVSRAGQMMFNTQFFCLNLKVHCGKTKKQKTNSKNLVLIFESCWKWSRLQGWMWWLGGCSVSLTLRPRTAAILHSMSKLMFIPYFWSLFFFKLIFSTFTSIQSDSPFFITPTSVFMNVWIFHSESVFFVLNFDLNSVFFLILSLITVIFILVFVQKKDIWDALAQSLFSLSISSFC